MKTLILNGSPRKKGDTMFIIEKLSEKLEGEVILVNVYEEKASPCIDCRYCWTHQDCALKDDMFRVYDLMDVVDNVVLASPIYFTELTGPLLSYTSRFQRYYVDKYLNKNPNFSMKEKKGAIILAGGDPTRSIDRPITTGKIIFRHISTTNVGTVSTLNTNEVPASKDSTIDDQVEKLAKLLNTK